MKKYILFGLALIILSSCHTSKSGVKMEINEGKELILKDSEVSHVNPLESYLRRTAGVRLTGSGENATVIIHGINSINNRTEPLFVVDGNVIGRSYTQAYQAVLGTKLKSVRVLKGSDATLYGVRGASGVIIIKTKM